MSGPMSARPEPMSGLMRTEGLHVRSDVGLGQTDMGSDVYVLVYTSGPMSADSGSLVNAK